MPVNNSRGFIQLVYSSPPEGNKNNSDISERSCGQFELFANEKPDLIIFVQPEQLGFDGIVQIIAVGHARRILDLREVPFISFGNETRESFLKLLKKNRTEYFNIFKLRHELGRKVNHVENIEEKFFPFDQNEVTRILKPMIEAGPTVVFSDCAPNEDKAIRGLLDILSQANISYSPVYAQ